MRAIIHIGTEKTGSTSIQNTLWANRELLSSKGCHVLECAGRGNSRQLPSYCLALDRRDDLLTRKGILEEQQRRQFREDFLHRYQEELARIDAGTHTVLISSEHFHTTLVRQEELITLKSLLDMHFSEVKIVIYLREQASAIQSRYTTYIMSGRWESMEDYLDGVSEQSSGFNYDTSLARWESVFGIENMDARIFHHEQWSGGDLLEDFLKGIASNLPLDRDSASSNVSLSESGQALGKAINRVFPRDEYERAAGRLWRRLINATQQNFPGKGERIGEDKWQALTGMFAASNERVRQRYFPHRDYLFDTTYPVGCSGPVDGGLQSGLEAVLAEIPGNTCLVPRRYIDLFRDVAILLETEHLSEAHQLMELAHTLRPSGSLIESKYLEYKRRLEGEAVAGAALKADKNVQG